MSAWRDPGSYRVANDLLTYLFCRCAYRGLDATFDEKTERMTNEEKLVKMILDDLRSDDEAELEKALGRIILYVSRGEMAKKQNLFFIVGGHQAVVRVMKDHEDSKTIQDRGIRVLMNATYKNAVLKGAVAKVEGIQVVLSAMKRFDSDRELIWRGFQALVNTVLEH